MSAKQTRYVGGFTIVELLIALAITGILMASIAIAFNASVVNCRENEAIFTALNSARQAMHRMTTQLRTAEAVDPNGSANECALITADGDSITFRYDPDDDILYLVTNDTTADPDYILCDNVTAMSFAKDTAVKDSVLYVKDVRMSMTVSRGGIEKTLASAAVIRRSLD